MPATPRHLHQLLPLLPSGSDGVHNLALRGDQLGHHNMAEREGFEPSVRDKRTHAFQACSLNHSDISPDYTQSN
jgi:hypothetical protein